MPPQGAQTVTIRQKTVKAFGASLKFPCLLFHFSKIGIQCLGVKISLSIIKLKLLIVCVRSCVCVCHPTLSVIDPLCPEVSPMRDKDPPTHAEKTSSTHHGNRSHPAMQCPLRPEQMLPRPLT